MSNLFTYKKGGAQFAAWRSKRVMACSSYRYVVAENTVFEDVGNPAGHPLSNWGYCPNFGGGLRNESLNAGNNLVGELPDREHRVYPWEIRRRVLLEAASFATPMKGQRRTIP